MPDCNGLEADMKVRNGSIDAIRPASRGENVTRIWRSRAEMRQIGHEAVNDAMEPQLQDYQREPQVLVLVRHDAGFPRLRGADKLNARRKE